MDPAAGLGITAYLQQIAGAGRRGVAAKFFNFTCTSQNWMTDEKCIIQVDAHALVAVLRRLTPKYVEAPAAAESGVAARPQGAAGRRASPSDVVR